MLTVCSMNVISKQKMHKYAQEISKTTFFVLAYSVDEAMNCKVE